MTITPRITLTACLLLGASSFVTAQEPYLQQGPPQGQPQRPNGRQGPGTQNPNPAPGVKPPINGEPISPAYIQQMFDAMAIVEAERFLPLSAEQYPGFVQKLKRLQEAKTLLNRKRVKAMNELRSLAGPQAPPDVTDAMIDAKLKELLAVEADGLITLKKAQDDLDIGLSVRQRARYRMLEENVERRKIDFLTKVRQGGGGFEGIPQ